MSAPVPLCDLCDVELATLHCAQCAPGGLGNLCADDDAALHADAKKKIHVRVAIGGGSATEMETAPTDAQSPPPVAASADPTPFNPASTDNGDTGPTLAADTFLNTAPSSDAAAPSTPLKVAGAHRAGHSRTTSAGRWASARLKLASVRQFSRVKSLFGSAAAITKLSVSSVPSAAVSRRTSLIPAVTFGSAPLQCQLCSSALATIYCDTCRRDEVTSGCPGPLYCTPCDSTYHIAHQSDFHFRQSVQEALPAMQLEAALEAAKLHAQSSEEQRDREGTAATTAAAATAAAATVAKAQTAAVREALPTISSDEDQAASRIQAIFRGVSVRRAQLQAKKQGDSDSTAPSDVIIGSSTPVASPPAASVRSTAAPPSRSTSFVASAAVSRRGSQAVAAPSALELLSARSSYSATGAAATVASTPTSPISSASLAALAAKSSSMGSPRQSAASAAVAAAMVASASSTPLPTSSPSAAASPSPMLRPLSGLTVAAAAASWVPPPLNPAASPTSAVGSSNSSSNHESGRSAAMHARPASRAVSRTSSRQASPVGSPLVASGRTILGHSAPGASGGSSSSSSSSSSRNSLVHSSSSTFAASGPTTSTSTTSHVTDTSLALFLAKLDVLESRLKKDSLALLAERQAFETLKNEREKKLHTEMENKRENALKEIQKEVSEARDSLRRECESVRAASLASLSSEIELVRSAALESLRAELGEAREKQKKIEEEMAQKRNERESEFVQLLQRTVTTIVADMQQPQQQLQQQRQRQRGKEEEKESSLTTPAPSSVPMLKDQLRELKKQLRAEIRSMFAEEAAKHTTMATGATVASSASSSHHLSADVDARERIRTEEVDKLLKLVPPRAAKILAARLSGHNDASSAVDDTDASSSSFSHRRSRHDSKPLTREELEEVEGGGVSSDADAADAALHIPLSARWEDAVAAATARGLAASMPSSGFRIIAGGGGGGGGGLSGSGVGAAARVTSLHSSQPRSYFHAILNGETAASSAASMSAAAQQQQQNKQPLMRPSPPPSQQQPPWNGLQSAPPVATMIPRRRPGSAVHSAASSQQRRNTAASPSLLRSSSISQRLAAAPQFTAPSPPLVPSSFVGIGASVDEDLRFLVDSTLGRNEDEEAMADMMQQQPRPHAVARAGSRGRNKR